ncbi:hypothetical protein Lalb_Chr03g0032031 [Lupinus albus]|uniref:Uncharacterized protein n=1 Tax=Lupinus albus TaxID=3870 RepID=A0A6A4QU19_LUPAL|nr:hypothetical protein Lalb_Chr03g0032031 [Lupinus albus]
MEMKGGTDDEVEDGKAGKVQSEFKSKVFEEKRSSKLSLQEFLYLLSLFNKTGIHFC